MVYYRSWPGSATKEMYRGMIDEKVMRWPSSRFGAAGTGDVCGSSVSQAVPGPACSGVSAVGSGERASHGCRTRRWCCHPVTSRTGPLNESWTQASMWAGWWLAGMASGLRGLAWCSRGPRGKLARRCHRGSAYLGGGGGGRDPSACIWSKYRLTRSSQVADRSNAVPDPADGSRVGGASRKRRSFSKQS